MVFMAKLRFKEVWLQISVVPRQPVLWLIRLYQHTLSPDHGPLRRFFAPGVCRFYPTCSEYGYEIIKKKGLTKGLFKTIWRIIRCNPWSRGGVDLP